MFLWFILTDCIDGRWGPDKQQRYKEGGCDKGGCHLQTHYLCMRSGFSWGGSWGEECMYGMCKRAAGALLRVRSTTPISAVMFSISSLLALSLSRVLALFFSVLPALSSRSDLLSWLWLTKALSLLHSFSHPLALSQMLRSSWQKCTRWARESNESFVALRVLLSVCFVVCVCCVCFKLLLLFCFCCF